MHRVHNFSAGPAALPDEVLEIAKDELMDYHGQGTSIMEQSHRGDAYTKVDHEAKERLDRLLELDDQFHIMFLQGGASTQFMQIPFNFLNKHETADYINTGVWSKKAIKEAKLFGKVHEAYSGENEGFSRVPQDSELNIGDQSRYVHYTSNNTIYGTQFPGEPDTGGIPLICDASSDFISRPIDSAKYGLIYAGAQKNLGPSGVTVVLVRKEFLQTISKTDIPTILDYRTHADRIFNTPPTFAVYMVNLVLKWVEEQGGITHFQKLNAKKAEALYREIDKDSFYKGMAHKDSRSKMNVTFRLPDESLEERFVKEAAENNLVALKGHRSAGGIRASIYNACSLGSVEALVSFMGSFRNKYG
jgi:phosphoserine aminotransferase